MCDAVADVQMGQSPQFNTHENVCVTIKKEADDELETPNESNKIREGPNETSVSGHNESLEKIIDDPIAITNIKTEVEETITDDSNPADETFTSIDIKKELYKCDHCEYLTFDKSSLDSHQTRKHSNESALPHKTTEFFNCTKCSFVAKNKSGLDNHLQYHIADENELYYKCVQCNFRTLYKKSLSYHILHSHNATNDHTYKCDKCKYTTKTLCYFQRHQAVHNDERPFSCKLCNFRCKTAPGLKRHQHIHRETVAALEPHSQMTVYTCEICFFVTTHDNEFTKHMSQHNRKSDGSSIKMEKDTTETAITNEDGSGQDYHEIFIKTEHEKGEDSYNMDTANEATLYQNYKPFGKHKCEICDFRSRTQKQMKDHTKLHTKLDVPFKCKKCSFTTTDKIRQDKHEKTHKKWKSKLFQCNICEFTSRSIIKMHRHEPIHQDIRPFHCGTCSFRATSQKQLRRHEILHKTGWEYECKKCRYVSNNQADLNNHRLIHNVIKETFECNKCSFIAKTENILQTHKLLHTEHRPYKCDQCTFNASSMNSILQHKLIHKQSNNRFHCPECPYMTKWQAPYTTHLKMHDGQGQYKCDQCTYAAYLEPTLHNHLRLHIRRKLYCDECPFICKNIKHMERHKIGHQVITNYNNDDKKEDVKHFEMVHRRAAAAAANAEVVSETCHQESSSSSNDAKTIIENVGNNNVDGDVQLEGNNGECTVFVETGCSAAELCDAVIETEKDDRSIERLESSATEDSMKVNEDVGNNDDDNKMEEERMDITETASDEICATKPAL